MKNQDQMGGFIGLWIIEKESGIPITYVELEGKSKIDSVLFSGFLVAIRGFMNDFQIGQLNSFTTDLAKLLITGSEELLSVLAIEKEVNVDYWYPTLIHLQRESEQFYQNLKGKKTNILVDTTVFDQLKPRFRDLIISNIDRILENTTLSGTKKSDDDKKAQYKLKESGLW